MRRRNWLYALLATTAAAPAVLAGLRSEAVAAGGGRGGGDGQAPEEVLAPATAWHAARIWVAPGSERPYVDDGWLLVRDGRVVAVLESADQLPPLTRVVELGEQEILPGLVAADSTVTGVSGQGDQALGAHRRALDDFDPFQDWSKVLEHGVTTVYLSPDRNRLVGGRGAVVKTAGDDRVLVPEADLRVALGPEAWNPPPFFRPPIPPSSDHPIEPARPQPPRSLAGALMALRETFAAALHPEGGGFDAHREALARVLAAGLPLRVAASRPAELRGALDLARTTGLPLRVEGAAAAGELARDLAAAGAVVLFKVPLFASLPDLGSDWEPPAPDVLARLEAAGVPVALGVDRHGRWPLLLEAAAAARAYGLGEEAALAGVTTAAARFLGLGERVGSLLPGRDADFVVLTGPPLDPATAVQEVRVAGERAWVRPDRPEYGAGAMVVRAGTVWTGDGPPLTGGAEVLLQEGRVAAVGHTVPHPPGAGFLDAGPRAHLTPGLVDAGGRLGLGGSRPSPEMLLELLAAGSRFRPEWLQVARAGVTTVVLEPASTASPPVAVPAVKTAAVLDEAAVAGRRVVHFSVAGGDHAARERQLRDMLQGGKAYFEKWEKYRKERAKWEEEQAAKEAKEAEERDAALRKALVEGREPPPEERPAEEEGPEVTEEEAPQDQGDPVNGLWEIVLENEMLPQPVTVHARLHHEGDRIKAVLSSPDFPEDGTFETEGTWDAESLSARFEVEADAGVTVVVTCEVDAPDHMTIHVELPGMGSFDFEGNRIEREDGGTLVQAPRRRVRKDKGPQPPRKDPRQEGLRALFEGRAVAVVEASRADEIRLAVTVFSEFGLPLVLEGADEAAEVADLLREKQVGVLAGPPFVHREKGADRVPAAAFRALGLPVAFRSATGGGARFLPDALALATRYGLGAEDALAGLTWRAADLLGLADRVGRLRPGLDGDLVVFSGPPLALGSRVLHVFVNGLEVPPQP